MVAYDGKHAEGFKVGKLTVGVVHEKAQSIQAASRPGEVLWVYYLKGVGSHM